jgi:hypothetical protein
MTKGALRGTCGGKFSVVENFVGEMFEWRGFLRFSAENIEMAEGFGLKCWNGAAFLGFWTGFTR